ncbi:MAG: glycosyltransferase [Burkholderiales bacterium]|nr:glycosyltransferase [Bacteroidia bacterium]
MNLKVVHIFNELKFSGAEIMVKAAKSKFEEHLIETTILSTGNILGDFSEELAKCSYTIKHIPFRKSLVFVISIYNFFLKNKFDVVHIHTERFFFFYIVIAKLAGVKKIIRTIHSTFVFNGWLARRRKKMLKLGSLLGCQYISISKNVFENELKLNNIQTILINNWIDTDHFKKSKKETDASSNTQLNFISVGTCSHLKRHFYILELVSSLKKLGCKVNYLHLGSGELEEDEKILAKHLNISDSVHFLGNQTKVLPYLQQSSFFLMPSEYEGLPISCLEAMATGTIPIVSDVPGLRDLVTNELNGLVVDFNNLEMVTKQIINLFTNNSKRIELSENARFKVIENYSLSNTDTLIKYYFIQ